MLQDFFALLHGRILSCKAATYILQSLVAEPQKKIKLIEWIYRWQDFEMMHRTKIRLTCSSNFRLKKCLEVATNVGSTCAWVDSLLAQEMRVVSWEIMVSYFLIGYLEEFVSIMLTSTQSNDFRYSFISCSSFDSNANTAILSATLKLSIAW